MAKSENGESDWFGAVLAVVNPALIMGLVGSLAFFLLDVGYRGEFIGQMRWTMFFFVFGAVLVARICLLMNNQYGAIYGCALGLATFAVSFKYVSGAGVLVSIVVIIVIALSAYFVTRDCTWMERPERVAPQGMASELGNLWQLLPTQPTERRKRRHGLSIVWFALAAIPLFGLGQWLIPVMDLDRRWSAFQFMTIYIACSLGLLLTTALVSLRSYLQARKLKMPAAMTTMWLISGVVLIIATLAVGALFPRPHSEFFSLTGLQSPQREASQIAPKADRGGQGEGDPGADGKEKSGSKVGKNTRGNHDEKAEQKNKDGKKGPGGDKNSKDGQGENQSEDPEGVPKPQSVKNPLEQLASGLQAIVKWIAIIGIGLLVLFLLIRGWAGMSERFRKWLEQFLKKKVKPAVPPPIPAAAAETTVQTTRSFASYDNPFVDGLVDHRSDDDLVRYSFAALEAWANEHGQARTADETPIEFARAIGEADMSIQEPAMKLTGHMMRLAFSASHRTSAKLRDDLRELWVKMEETGDEMN